VKIAELPLRERPVNELLDLDIERPEINRDYAGYGWAKVDEIWLEQPGGDAKPVRDALVIALHSADDAEAIADDIELYFELPDRDPVTVLASQFFAEWLPRLPAASAIVLALCNPHRAALQRPATAPPIYYALGDVEAWIDEIGDEDYRIRLAVEDSWVRLHDVTTALERQKPISEDQKQSLIGLWLLKKMDLKPEDGGMEMPVVLPGDLGPLDDYLQQLAVEDYVSINQKKGRYELTKKGLAYLGQVIDEAQEMVDELDELETEEAVAELRARNLDLLRSRFLWGWYEGEFDDMVLFQERRGVQPVERMWAFYLTSDEFFRELAKDFEPPRN
jgi:hypothetical protein